MSKKIIIPILFFLVFLAINVYSEQIPIEPLQIQTEPLVEDSGYEEIEEPDYGFIHLIWIPVLFLGLLFYAWKIKDTKLDYILRKRYLPWVMIIGAYIVSYLGLGPWWKAIYWVLFLAPAGILSLIPIKTSLPSTIDFILIILVHIIFWTLLIALQIGMKKMSRKKLRIIWFIIYTMLLLTMAGCSQLSYKI